MILGIGMDLVDLERIEGLISERFIDRVLSVEEKKIYTNTVDKGTKLAFIGGRFAAKEAIFKAIGTGTGKTNYTDFSVLRLENGAPYVKTEYFNKEEIVHITITHTDKCAIAYVMIEKV